MRQAGRYQPEYRRIREKMTLLDICRTPDVAAQVTLMAVEQLGAFVDAGVRGVYLVPPILKGGVRDYDVAQRVLAKFRG